LGSKVDLQLYGDKIDRFCADALASDKRTSACVTAVILPEEEEIRKAQLKSTGSAILAWFEAQMLGVGSYKTYAPIIRVLFEKCPIEFGILANFPKKIRGRFLFTIPYDKDHYIYTYIDSKGRTKELKLPSRFWGFKIYGLGNGFLGRGEQKVTFEKGLGHAPAKAGFESSKSDELVVEGFNSIIKTGLLCWEGIEAQYERVQGSIVGMVNFELKNSSKEWKENCETQSMSPQDFVVLFFNVCSKLVGHIKEDFPRIINTHPLFHEDR